MDYCIGWMATVSATAVFLSMPVKADSMASRVVCFLGKNSLVIMCFHILAEDLVWRILYPFFGTPGLGVSLAYAAIVTLLCVPVIYIYNCYIKPKL